VRAMKVLINGKDLEEMKRLEELRMERITEISGWLAGLFTWGIKK